MTGAGAEELSRSLQTFKQDVLTLSVIDADGFKKAGEIYNTCLAYEKRVGELWDGEIKAAHDLHKGLIKKRDMMLEPALEAKTHIRGEMKKHTDMMERHRKAEEARLRELARREAEERALATAIALEQNGHVKQAEEVIAKPVEVPRVALQSTTPKGFGNITRKTWRAEVVDLMALVKAVATGEAPPVLIEPCMVALNNLARAQKENFKVPGVRAISE